MPKIRGVKPDYWTDEAIVELSLPARLLFIGLWNYACDNGHLQDKPKQIKMRLLPGDDVNVSELLRELESAGRIGRTQGYITIPNFTKHQRPDKRYFQRCDAPGCADSQPETRGGHGERTTSAPRDHNGGSWGAPGDGDSDMKGSDGDSARGGKPAAKRAVQLPADWQPSEEHHKLAADRGVDLSEEVAKFRDWCRGNGATKKDWEATFRNWLRNARPTGNVRPFPQPDEQGRIPLGPLPPRSPWGQA